MSTCLACGNEWGKALTQRPPHECMVPSCTNRGMDRGADTHVAGGRLYLCQGCWDAMPPGEDQEVAALRARVAELQSKLDERTLGPGAAEFDRVVEDFKRKRDECARLEKALAEQSKQREYFSTEAGVAHYRIAQLDLENQRLRRELRGKR